MDTDQFQLFEYGQKRIKQKKRLYFHFIIFLLVSLFSFIINKLLDVGNPYNWYIWVIVIWSFFFIFHVINVFITESFMNKHWEKNQMEKLINLQKKQIKKIERHLEEKEEDTNKTKEP